MTRSVRIVEEFGAIEDEAKRWRLLSEDSNSPMQQYAWVKACSDAFADCGKLHLIVVGTDQPGALGPFIIRGRRLNRMECLGVDELYEPSDFPHSDPASLICLVNTLVELRRPLLLRRILAAHLNSVTWFYDPKNRAEAVAIMVEASKIKPEDVEKS